MILRFSGLPCMLQKNQAALKAVSLDSAPPVVKKIVFSVGPVSRATRAASSMAGGFDEPT